jgi:MraZ protein
MLGERCQVTSALDSKGRIGLPAKLRHKIKESGINALVLTCVDGGIRGFTPDYFATRIEGPYADADPFDPAAQAYFYAVLADAETCTIDAQGRIRIPARLREQAGLDKDVRVISILHWLEFWSPAAWESAQADARKSYRANRARPAPPQG